MKEEISKKIDENLKKYPNLKKVIQTAKKTELFTYPYKNQNMDEKEYTIWGIIHTSQDNLLNSQYFNYWLLKLEKIIESLSPKPYSKEQIQKGLLRNPFNFLSELIFAEFCVENEVKIIDIEPELKLGSKLDFLIKKEGTNILVEVTTPLPKPDFSGCGGYPMSLKLENNIRDKFNKHKIIKNKIEQPFIIVMDSYRWKIDAFNVFSSIKEFNNKHKSFSPYLSGIFVLNCGRNSLDIGTVVGNHLFIENLNSKYPIKF
jgi:hypothetical protein